jgi:hypothetical protein
MRRIVCEEKKKDRKTVSEKKGLSTISYISYIPVEKCPNK